MMRLVKFVCLLAVLMALPKNSYEQCPVIPPVPNDACYQAVIAADPWCCNNAWDALCQTQYDALGCGGGGGPCPVVAPVPNDPCYQQVIAADPFCCNTSWDINCQNAYTACTGAGTGTGCNTNISICTPGVAGPFGFTTASTNPSTCLDFWNGAGAPNYAYIILYITQSGPLNLLIDGDNTTGCIDVAIFDVTGQPDPCAALSPATEIGCNYASNCDGCNEFGSNFPCLSEVPAPMVNAGDVLFILIEDWSNSQTNFTLELSNAPGSAQTGPGNPTINPSGPYNDTDPPVTVTAANGGGTWSADCGPCIDPVTGVFDPGVAGNGTWTICYDLGAAPCDAQDCETIVVGCTPPDVNPLANVTDCDSYTLPAITGTNLTGNEAYFTGPNGTGTQYNPGQVITTTTTLFIYDEASPACFDQETFTITLDVTDPTINCPGNLTAVCSITEQPPYANYAAFTGAGGTANDDTNLNTGSFTLLSEVSDGNSCPEVVTRTYQIEDACGHTATCVQTITINDLVAPVFAAPPANVTVECTGDVPAMTNLGWTDNCDGAGSVAGTDGAIVGGNCGGTITRTWTYTDNCGNNATTTQTITINDTQAPVFAAPPANVTVQCAGDVPAMTNLGYTDNCDAPGTVAGADVSDGNTCPEVITRTWTYTDACGNTSSVSQTITVHDTQAPVFAAPPANVTVECAGDVPAMTNLGYTDNCDAPGTVAGNDVSDGLSCPETITRTWTYTDACGNTSSVTQTILIDDTTLPTASTPAPINLAGGPAPAPDPAVIMDEADNCGVPVVALVSNTSDGGSCPETITHTYSVTDACGNQITVDQVYIIGDPNPPTASNPADIFVMCIGDVPLPDPLVVTDEADDQGVPVVAWVSDVSDNNPCPETITRTYSVTDNCGNFIFVTHNIVVQDLIPPSGTAPGPASYQCIGDVPPGTPGMLLSATDNCTANPAVAYIGDVSDGNTCPETILRSWTITDDCGNVTQVDQAITVHDTQAPVLDPAPANVTVECIGDVPAMVNLNYTDNCDAPGSVVGVDVSDGNTCPEVITRTWTYTDACGNVATVSQTITVDDTTPPTASNPAQTIVPGGPAPAPDPNVVIDEADNCTANPVVAFVSQVSDNNPCPETITYTYSVTDDCGNTINVTHDVLITDPIAPTGTPPADITVDCITAVPAPDPALITDEADNNGLPTVTHLSDVSDGNSCPEVITRTYRITDPCGNFTDVTQLITVHDLTPPTGTAPAMVTVECIGDVPPADPLLITDEADNCGTPTVAFVGDVSDNNSCPETITRTYSITDSCGNSINVDQTIVVDDTTPPTATGPAAITVECIADVPLADPALITDEADNCDPAPVVAFVSDVSDGNTCPETITRTYSITDACGNVTNVTQTITVDDTTNPTASNPANINQAGGLPPAPDPNVVIDEADNCDPNPVVAFVSDVSDGNNCPETITRTYSVTDFCGNQITVSQLIIIGDPIPPTGTAPADMTVDCITAVPLPDPLLITDEADNNGVPAVTWNSDVSDGNSCPEVITRTYDITDPCGNVVQVTQLITVHDLTPPTGTAPANIAVECIGDVPPADPLLVTDEADNCGTPTVTFVGDVSDGLSCPETITRTYAITDSCGNTTNVDQIITVDDITGPTGTAPATVNVECIGDVPLADPALITDEADNCDPAPVVAFVSDVSDGLTCPETITRTYSITDACGNVTNVTQSIIVNDITPPTASNPAQTIVPGGPAPAPDPNVVIDEADNCTIAPVVAFVSQVSDNNPCPETITYTYSVTDDCGNSINVTHEVLITDPILPTGTAPADITVECASMVPAADPLLITDEADNNGVPAVAFVSDVSDGNSCPEIITRTYSITDQCGNVVNVTQLITIDDTTNPTASNPAPINVQCIGDVPAFDINVVTDEADNCTANPVVAFVSDVSDGNTCPELITRTYSVTDDCGNSINVTQTITVDDTTNPTASNPVAVNVECIGDVPAADPAVVTDEADNCTANPTVVFVSDVSDGNTCPEVITRTYSVTDDCGNTINVTQTITVNDITNPTASNPAQLNVSCPSDVPAPDPAVVTDAADNCGVPVVAHVGDVSDGNACNNETITRTYSVTDACGNSINVTQIIVIGAVAPTVDAGVDQSVCEGTMVTLNVNASNGTVSWDQGVIDGVAFNSPVGTTTYTVTADVCAGTCVATDQVDITVNATPVVSFSGDDLTGCEPHTVNFTNTSTEQGNCIWDFGDGNTANNCGPVSHTYLNAGNFDVTLTVTSAAGCTATATYPSYIDVVPMPVAVFGYSPSDYLVVNYTEVQFENTSLNADSYLWTFGDNTISTDSDPTHTYPPIPGDYEVILYAYSNAGCYDSTTAVITVQDELIFYVPNTFTPDGDNFNDSFLPQFASGLDVYDYHLTIFNRWGEVVFESYNVLVGWNGHYGDGGLVEDGVYIWQLEFGETMSDKKHKHRGHVTVLK